jgi:hypothetical protein
LTSIEEEKDNNILGLSSKNTGIKELNRSDYTYAEFESSEGLEKGKIKVAKDHKKKENRFKTLLRGIRDFSLLEMKKKIDNSFVEVVLTCKTTFI